MFLAIAALCIAGQLAFAEEAPVLQAAPQAPIISASESTSDANSLSTPSQPPTSLEQIANDSPLSNDPLLAYAPAPFPKPDRGLTTVDWGKTSKDNVVTVTLQNGRPIRLYIDGKLALDGFSIPTDAEHEQIGDVVDDYKWKVGDISVSYDVKGKYWQFYDTSLKNEEFPNSKIGKFLGNIYDRNGDGIPDKPEGAQELEVSGEGNPII
jgi:hypothetical protein